MDCGCKGLRDFADIGIEDLEACLCISGSFKRLVASKKRIGVKTCPIGIPLETASAL